MERQITIELALERPMAEAKRLKKIVEVAGWMWRRNVANQKLVNSKKGVGLRVLLEKQWR